MLAIVLGASIFGVGMVIYGYCPGTGLAAIGTGSIHALAGVVGMMVGGILYALTYPWVAKNILPVADVGTMTLDKLLGIPVWAVFAILSVVAISVFAMVTKFERSRRQ